MFQSKLLELFVKKINNILIKNLLFLTFFIFCNIQVIKRKSIPYIRDKRCPPTCARIPLYVYI